MRGPEGETGNHLLRDGGVFTVSQQDSRDTVRYHTPKRISKLYLFQRRAEDSKKGGLEDDGNTS